MKKIFAVIAGLIAIQFSNFVAFGQHPEISVTIRSGLSLPLEDYASKDLAKGSFTLPGFAASLETSLFVYNQWGILAQGGVGFHPVDVGSLGYEKVLDDPFLQDVYIRSEAFRIIQLSGGILRRYELSNNFSFTPKVLAGIFFSQTPYQVYRPRYFQTGPDIYVITSAKDRSFTYGLGFDISYLLNDCLKVALSSEYHRSRAAFGFISGSQQRTDWRNISFLNILIGVQLVF
jgi:hypothetical protein